MKKILFLSALVSLSCLFSCSQDDVADSGKKEAVNLSELRVGQKSTFLLYRSDCSNFPQNITFTGDTLVWKITAGIENTFISTEYFTEGSPLSDLDPVSLQIKKTEDYVLLPNRDLSNLFFFYGNDTIHMNPLPMVELSQSNCCFLYESGDLFTGDDIGWVDSANYGDYQVENQLLVSCVPNGLNINGYILYNKGAIASIHSYDFDSLFIQGWLPLKQE